MYNIVTVRDTVRIPPKRFEEDLEDVIKSELAQDLVGRVSKEIGIVLSITDVLEVGEGRIILGDGAVYYDVDFQSLAYKPILNEVVEGDVSEITDFGAFVSFGPLDGLIHISQVTEDFMSHDEKNNVLVGKESGKVLKLGDKARCRIVAVSLKDNLNDTKIGLTMRQPYLGKFEWIEDERKNSDKDPESDEDKKDDSAKGAKKKGKKE